MFVLRSHRFVALIVTIIVAIVAMTPSASADVNIFRGASTYRSDILYTWDGRHIYGGVSTYRSDILYTWDGRHLYRGASTYSSDILYTWDGRHLYRGASTYRSDILITVNGPFPPILFTVL